MKLEDFVIDEDQKPLEGKFKRILDFVKKEVELKGSEAVAEEIRKFEERKRKNIATKRWRTFPES